VITTDRPAKTYEPPAKPDVAAKVKAQLARDFPPGAMGWIGQLTWRGPQQVPLTMIDYSRSRSWSAAKNPRKVSSFAARMRGGWRKPVVLIRTPDGRLTPVDGHTRLLAARLNGAAVDAWIGTAAANHGAWEQAHAKQKDQP
jgi:hypothetical protein